MTAPAAPSDRFEIARRLQRDVLEPLKRTFVAKDKIVDALGVALVAGEHVFLLGPPGTAKSALVHQLAARLHGTSFSYLLTRFTEPHELFGPFDIRRLREGELLTNTAGMLPEAQLAFLDELMNANSSILNSLLGVLNERVFRRGSEVRRLPLRMAVGASNRLPEDETLGALFDRFLLRVVCDAVPEDRLGDVLHAGWQLERQDGDAVAAHVSMEEVDQLATAVGDVDLQPVHADFLTLCHEIRRAGLDLTDRRAVKMQRIVAASAVLCGRSQATRSDLWVFRHVWSTLEQRELLAGLVDKALQDFEQEEGAADHAHPAARGGARPDPENLASDLDTLLDAIETSPADQRTMLGDRLQALAARCTWITDEALRGQLERRVDDAWQLLKR